MLMLALGDSITYGYGASSEELAYPQLLRQKFARTTRTSLHVQAKPGWTSRQLNKSLPELPKCIVDEAEVVTLMIGGNDLLRAAPTLLQGGANKIAQVCERSRAEIEEIVAYAKRPYNTLVLGILYNPFPNFQLAERVTNEFNQMLRAVAAANNLPLVDVYRLFRSHESEYVEHYKNGLLRDMRFFRNPIHPTDHGHRALCQGFFRTIQSARRLRQKRFSKRRIKRA